MYAIILEFMMSVTILIIFFVLLFQIMSTLLVYLVPIIIFSKAINNFQMLYEKQTSRIPKKTSQKLSKFSYYVDTFFPELFDMKEKTLDVQKKIDRPVNQLLTKPGNKSMVYSYFYSKCQVSAAIDESSILASVKKLYLNQDVIKINDMSYSRQSYIKQSYLPVYGFFSEIIDFVLIVDKQEKSDVTEKPKTQGVTKQAINSSNSGASLINQNVKTFKTTNTPKQYWLYVIHNCNSFKPELDDMKKISWEHFIERYHFTDKKIADSQSLGSIEYELVYSCKSDTAYFSFEQKLKKLFIQSHCKIVDNKTLENLQKLQGYLLQRSSQVQKNKQRQQDVAFSDEHRRQLKIPIQHYKQYISLKKQVYKFYINLHQCKSEDQVPKYFYENLICRYLIAKEYHFQEAKKSTFQYLEWEKTLTDKYPTFESFKEIHEIGAFRYIGEDFMGRPVVLNKAFLIDVNTMPDVDKYCDYYIYFMEIYLRTKMRGYVDQMVVIGDLNNLGSSNFKLAITKRNVADNLKYGPQRQYALITVNVSTFAYTAWTFIKPLLPKKTLHKIQITGHNKKDIIDALISRVDISVIPDYLGGQNKVIVSDLNGTLAQQAETPFQQSYKTKEGILKRFKQNGQDDSDEIQITSVESVLAQNKQPQSNGLFSIFESVTKTLGIKLGD